MSRKISLQVPGRHMLTLPPPKREIKETDLWDKPTTSPPTAAASSPIVVGRPEAVTKSNHVRVIAYIAHAPRCLHSDDLLRLANEVRVPVQVYDIDKVDPPTWMPGTPTLETEHGAVFCGDSSFEWILAQSKKQQERVSNKNTAGHVHHRRPQHPEIVPRTVENVQSIMAEAKPYEFLAAAPDSSASLTHKPAGGGNLSSVFKESERLEHIANRADNAQIQNATDKFTEMMNARA